MSLYQSYHDNERIRMASNAYLPDNTVPIWSVVSISTVPCSLLALNNGVHVQEHPTSVFLDSQAFEIATPYQNIFEPTQPFLPLIGDNFPNSWQTLPDSLYVQAVERDTFPSLTTPPGFSSFYPPISTRPVYDVARNCNPCYEGVTEAKLGLTGDVLPSSIVPVIPPVCFVSRILKDCLILNNPADSICVVGCHLPSQLDRDTTKAL